MAISQYNIDLNLKGLEQLKVFQKELKHASKRTRELTAAQAKREAKGRTNTKVYEKEAKTLKNYAQKQKELKDNIDRTTESLRKNAKMMNHQNSSSKKAANSSKNLGKAMAVMGLSIAGAAMAVRRLARFMVDSVKTFAEFEKGVKNVTTLLSARDAGIFRGDLFKGSLNISKQYGFALNDVNKAMFNAVSAGVQAGDAVNFLNQASVLAVAGVTDLKSATLGLTTVLNAYGMEMTEADRISEILFTTQKFGVTTVSELSKAIGVVVPFAAASGISMEELGASIAVTTRSGLDAAKTVTALRAAISQMQKPAAESRDLFIKFGIPIGAAQMKAVGYTETLRRLNKVYRESPRDIELMFGNVRGLTAIFSLAGENAESYGRILEQITNDTGNASSVQKGLAENTDSAAMELARLGTAFQNLKVAIGDNEGIRNFVKELTDLLNILGSDKVSSAEKQTTGLMFALDKLGKFFTLLGPKAYSIMPEDMIEFDESSKGLYGTVTEKALSDSERKEAEEAFDEFEQFLFDEREKVTNILANLGYGYQDTGEKSEMVQIGEMSPMDIDDEMIEDIERYVAAANQINPQIFQERIDKELSDVDELIEPLKLFLDTKAALESAAIKKSEEEATLAGEQAQRFDARELEKRQKTIEAVNDIKMEALLTDEYVNETNLKINQAKLKEIIALQESLNEVDKDGVLVRKANAEQVQKIANERANIELKIKEQTIINERKNTKAYDDAVIKAKEQLEKDLHQITIQGIKDDETADEIKFTTLTRKKDFYEQIKGFAGQTVEEQTKTLKALSKLEIDFLKLDEKTERTDSPEYMFQQQQALLHFNETRKRVREQEAKGQITAFEATKKINQAEKEMRIALRDTPHHVSEKTRVKNLTKLSDVEIEMMQNQFNEFQLIEDQKNQIRMAGLQMAADFANQIGNTSLQNFQRRQDKEREALKQKLDDGRISQKQYDKDLEAIERKAFERKKKQEQSTALIAYLMELANIAVQAAANKANAWTFGTAGLKQYAALAAIASARFIGTTATIASQKFADGGMVYGNSHSQGGEKFAVGGRVVELEGGEAVINRRSSAMFRNELSAMNVAGGGVDFSRGTPNFNTIDYNLLAQTIGENTHVVLPVESLNQVQNRVKAIEDGSKF